MEQHLVFQGFPSDCDAIFVPEFPVPEHTMFRTFHPQDIRGDDTLGLAPVRAQFLFQPSSLKSSHGSSSLASKLPTVVNLVSTGRLVSVSSEKIHLKKSSTLLEKMPKHFLIGVNDVVTFDATHLRAFLYEQGRSFKTSCDTLIPTHWNTKLWFIEQFVTENG